MAYKPKEREYREAGPFTAPADGAAGEGLVLTGSPIVFGKPAVICVIEGTEYKEVIAPGALDECDMSDFILNRNHGVNDSTVFARTRNGSLSYEITAQGLNIRAELDGEDDRHKNLYRDVKTGRVDKMSFSFVVKEESYDRDTHTRTVRKIKKLYDVSAVDFPAYNETSITTARSFFTEEHGRELKELEERRRREIIAKTI